MISVQRECRLFGLVVVVAVTMMAGNAYGQSPSTEVMPPLSYPMSQYLHNNPEVLRDLMSRQVPPSPEPGPAPPADPSSVPSEQAPAAETAPASLWQLLTHPLGLNVSNPLLLTDGTVIVHRTCTPDWWRLTPDINGSYVDGTWSQIASLPSGYVPRFFGSAVLSDGRVIVEGGEYNINCGRPVWTNLGAMYDPVANTWKPVSPPNGWANIGDAQSVVLPDGTFMLANALTKQQALLNASTLTWTATGSGKFDVNDEEGWTLLWDGNVLTVDAYVHTGSCDTNSERYLTSFGSWISAGSTIQQLSDCGSPNFSFELGPQVLRPDGNVIAFGGTTSGVASSTLPSSVGKPGPISRRLTVKIILSPMLRQRCSPVATCCSPQVLVSLAYRPISSSSSTARTRLPRWRTPRMRRALPRIDGTSSCCRPARFWRARPTSIISGSIPLPASPGPTGLRSSPPSRPSCVRDRPTNCTACS